MLLQLLYEQADAAPERTAVVYRDERLTFAELLERIERLASGLGSSRDRARRRGRARAPRRPLVPRGLPRGGRDRRQGRPREPRLQAGRARILVSQHRRQSRDQRRAHRRRLRADRRRLRLPGPGDRLRRRPRPVGDARRPGRGGLGRAPGGPGARGAARRPVLLGLDRASEAPRSHPRAVRRRGRVLPRPRAQPGGQDPRRGAALPYLGHGRLHLRRGRSPARRW